MEFNDQKVEKNLKYLQKLFESALEDLVKAKVTQKQSELEDELNLIRSLNKNLETELFRVRRDKTELECKTSEQKEKISIL